MNVFQMQLRKVNENITAAWKILDRDHGDTRSCVRPGGRGLDYDGSGLGDVTGASALARLTSWSSRSPTEETETSVEHGAGPFRCRRSPSESNSSQGRGIRLSGLGATSEACLWIHCCVSPSSWALHRRPAKRRGAERSRQPACCSCLPELSHRLSPGPFDNVRRPVQLTALLLTRWKQISYRSVGSLRYSWFPLRGACERIYTNRRCVCGSSTDRSASSPRRVPGSTPLLSGYCFLGGRYTLSPNRGDMSDNQSWNSSGSEEDIEPLEEPGHHVGIADLSGVLSKVGGISVCLSSPGEEPNVPPGWD